MGETAVLRELSLALVGDERMSELHEEFMSIRGTTDVLTFPIDTDALGKVVSGEIVVCVAEARRQAKLRGIRVDHELLLYAVHGMLHLLGYDDRSERAYRVMHRVEDELMVKLGLGTLFARPPVRVPRKQTSRSLRSPRSSRQRSRPRAAAAAAGGVR